MATCLILMFGRLGAVGGSNFVGLLLDGHCELIFYLYSALILSKLSRDNETTATKKFTHSHFVDILGCSFVCFFLNTNPVEPSALTKDNNSVEIKCTS